MAAPLMFQSLSTRVAILICFWSALLLSVPSWLRLTTIQRLPLPTRQVEALQASATCPVTFASTLKVLVDPAVLPQEDNDGGQGHATFLQQVQQLLLQSLELKAEQSTAASLECTRWKTQVFATTMAGNAELINPETGAYAIRVLSESSVSDNHEELTLLPTVFLPFVEEPTALPLVPDTVSAAVIAELFQLRGDKPLANDENASNAAIANTEQDPRVIQYSKHVRLVFSIMNQDVGDGAAYDSSLVHALAHADGQADNPIAKLTRELSSLHDFHVETQVQWFAPLHFQPTQEILEEVVEREVEDEVMVDKEIEEEVEVPVEVDKEDSEVLAEDVTYQATDESERADSPADDNEQEESEVEEQLPTAPPKGKRTKLIKVKRKRTIQVPRLQRVVKQTRTQLPPRHVVEWDDLKVFVNSQEWSLTSTVPPTSSNHSSLGRPYDVLSQTHDLHFLLYIPSKSHSPLRIRDTVTGGVNEGSNAWLIPQWGGVVILNVESFNSGTDLITAHSDKNEVRELPHEDVVHAITLFAKQLEILLGLSSHPIQFRPRLWQRRVQLSTLKQRRILELAREATSTLAAITRLVERIENLGVGPDVTADTEAALEILQALPLSSDGDLDGMLAKVQEAHSLSKRAFFNPDMLGLLYFPDEHKYAVYTPLFAPLLVPLLVTTLKGAKEVFAGGKKTGVRGRRSI